MHSFTIYLDRKLRFEEKFTLPVDFNNGFKPGEQVSLAARFDEMHHIYVIDEVGPDWIKAVDWGWKFVEECMSVTETV